MHIGVPAEIYPGETRVAATPETVKKLAAGGRHTVIVQAGAAAGAAIRDSDFEAAGATHRAHRRRGLPVRHRAEGAAARAAASCRCSAGAASSSACCRRTKALDGLAGTGVTAFAMELLPRISRAQAMDVLSSQANIAGYKAVLVAAYEYGRFMPMLMTAAGTVKAARVLVLGAGVAGLQAIATAKRLGAVIEAFDVRPAVKEQVESLGAKFVEVALSDEELKAQETAGGYAREMSDDYKQRQAALIAGARQGRRHRHHHRAHPRPPGAACWSPKTRSAAMKPGSVIVDLAVKQGGNCALSVADQVVVKNGVKIVAPSSLPADDGRRFERALRAQPAQLRQPAVRRQDRRAEDRPGRRNHRRHARLRRRRPREELTCTESRSIRSSPT